MVGHQDEADEDPTDEPWVLMALKVGLAMAIADLLGRTTGFDDHSVAVIATIFVAGQPPATSIGKGLRRWLAGMGGVAAGALAAYGALRFALSPIWPFLLLGLAAGATRTLSIDYLYAAVIGAVAVFAVQAGVAGGGSEGRSDLLAITWQIAWQKGVLVTIGFAVGPAVVVAVTHAWKAVRE